MHGAGAALGDAAPELGAGKPQDIAQRPQQGHVGRSIDIPHFAIYFQTDHVVPREGRQWFDCRALGRDYRATEQNLPWVVIELRPCLAPCRISLRLRLWHSPAVKSRIPVTTIRAGRWAMIKFTRAAAFAARCNSRFPV